MQPFKTGDKVHINYQGRDVDATVLFASNNGLSLMLGFDALLGGYLGSMPLTLEDDGRFHELLMGEVVTVEHRRARGRTSVGTGSIKMKDPPRIDGIAPAKLTIEEDETMRQPWLEDPRSLDAQIALVREMWRVRLLACGGDQNDPALIALSEVIFRLMRDGLAPTQILGSIGEGQ